MYAILKRNKDGYGGTINEFFKESKVTYNDLSMFFKYFLTWKSLDLKPISKTFHSKISTANMNDINKYDTINDFLKSEYESKGIPVTYPNGTIYNINMSLATRDSDTYNTGLGRKGFDWGGKYYWNS